MGLGFRLGLGLGATWPKNMLPKSIILRPPGKSGEKKMLSRCTSPWHTVSGGVKRRRTK